MYPILVDGDIYMRIQICNPLFSCNIGIQVGQVFLEISAPSGYCLKDQQKKVRVYKVLYRQALKEIMVLTHTSGLIQQ